MSPNIRMSLSESYSEVTYILSKIGLHLNLLELSKDFQLDFEPHPFPSIVKNFIKSVKKVNFFGEQG